MSENSELKGYFHLQHNTNFALEVDFCAPGQGVTAIFGASGAGKTTLLRCVAGLERASPGFFSIHGHCWQDESHGFFLPIYQRPIGYVFQEASLFNHLSVKANLEYGWHRTPAIYRKVTFDEAVALLGIEALLQRRPQHLSGGERQRVAIARALLTNPQLLLMDEPLASLDIHSKADILPYLETLHNQLSIPILYISHTLSEVMRLADYMLVIEKGKLLASGPLLDILTRLDLPLSQTDETGVIVEATIAQHDALFHLTYLDFTGGQLSIYWQDLPVGHRVRVRIKARDVSIALENEVHSSILNVFPAQVLAIAEDKYKQLMIKLNVQGTLLLAWITRKSGTLLNLQVGMMVYARVKSVALL